MLRLDPGLASDIRLAGDEATSAGEDQCRLCHGIGNARQRLFSSQAGLH